MAWIVLVTSGLFEAVWASALERITSIRDVAAIAAFLAGTVISVGGLWWALKSIPLGTGYAVWVGVGVVATVTWAFVSGSEAVSLVKILLIAGILACVVGLKLIDSAPAA